MRIGEHFIRNVHIGDLLEIFFVSSISSILIIRFYLAMAGYPHLGGQSFHIAHMLLGGLLLMIALVLTLSFLGNKISRLAAIIGGVGFGAFIDELGKFITHDNNYFFEPTVALIYVIFVILFFAFRHLDQYRPLTDKEYVLNAFHLFEEVISEDLDQHEKKRLMQYIKHAKNYPFSKELQALAESIETSPPQNETIFQHISHSFNGMVQTIVRSNVFRRIVLGFFILQALILFLNILLIATINVGNIPLLLPEITLSPSPTVYAEIFSVLLSGGLVIAGIAFYRFNREQAYEFFKYSVLISILITQFFVFYREQFQALTVLILNLVTLVTLNVAMKYEKKVTRKIVK